MKTDLQIQHDVQAELRWEPSIDAAHIGVEVIEGIVTLAAHVGSYAEKWDAERIAQRIAGVRALTIALEVRLPGGNQRDDAYLVRTAEQALAWAAQVPAAAVHVMVEGGYVTLSGTVDWEYQRRAAAGSVRGLTGVTGVSDQIAIRPKIPAAAVKSEIEAALRRSAGADAQQIQVAVCGASVTLTGVVHSWAERDVARHAAWGTHGVCHVADHILVAS
jgi:osmotically-inducible protein OsmY